jgi:hypothetical protein
VSFCLIKKPFFASRIENLIFYKAGDKNYIRTAPFKVKQTKATRKRAAEFGKAYGNIKFLRQPLLFFPTMLIATPMFPLLPPCAKT